MKVPKIFGSVKNGQERGSEPAAAGARGVGTISTFENTLDKLVGIRSINRDKRTRQAFVSNSRESYEMSEIQKTEPLVFRNSIFSGPWETQTAARDVPLG